MEYSLQPKQLNQGTQYPIIQGDRVVYSFKTKWRADQAIEALNTFGSSYEEVIYSFYSGMATIGGTEDIRDFIRVYDKVYQRVVELNGTPMNQGSIYVLQLENGKYYVGWSDNVALRITKHFTGHGAKWTKLHNPFNILLVLDGSIDNEPYHTLNVMRQKGINNVRGAAYCQCDEFTDKKVANIQKRINKVFK